MPERYPEFAARIKKSMKAAGVTGERLAEELGVRPQTVSAWRNGEYMPEAERIQKIAAILMVTPEALAGNPSAVYERYNPDPVVALLMEAKKEQAEWLHSFSQRLIAAVEAREVTKSGKAPTPESSAQTSTAANRPVSRAKLDEAGRRQLEADEASKTRRRRGA